MTTDEALKQIQDHVQWCRTEGETDLRGILFKIKDLRKQLSSGVEAAPASGSLPEMSKAPSITEEEKAI